MVWRHWYIPVLVQHMGSLKRCLLLKKPHRWENLEDWVYGFFWLLFGIDFSLCRSEFLFCCITLACQVLVEIILIGNWFTWLHWLQVPINPYGKAKKMAEDIILDFSKNSDMAIMILRLVFQCWYVNMELCRLDISLLFGR